MKKQRAFMISFCALLIILGFFFEMYYLNAFVYHTKYFIYLLFSIFSFAESLFVGFSLYLYFMGLKNRFATIIYIISALLAIPVMVFAIFWFLYFIGIQILPLPQQ